MGWGTDFKADVYLNKLTFINELEVQNKIDENISDIQDAKQRIKMFASATLSDIIPDDWKDEPIDWLNNSLNELFETISQLTEENVRLNQYIEYLDGNGEDKITIDWNTLNKILSSETAKAYKSGMFKEDLSETQPYLSTKKEVEDLIKKYAE